MSNIIDKLQTRIWNWLEQHTFHKDVRFLDQVRFLGDVTFEGTDPTAGPRMKVQDGADAISGPRDKVKVIAGTNITATVADDEPDDRINVTISAPTPMKARKNGGAVVGGRASINVIEGANIIATVADNPANDRIDITLAASGSSVPTQTAGSSAVTVTSAASAGVWGAYTELIASTSFAAIGLQVNIHYGSNGIYGVKIAFGAAGSEVDALPLIPFRGAPANVNIYVPHAIPSGTRVSAASVNQGDATAASIIVQTTVFG